MLKHRNILLLMILGLIIWIVNLILHPIFVLTPDAAIYADMAKHAVQENKFTTSTTFPQHLVYFSKLSGDDNFLSQYPVLHPLIISIFFRLFGINDISLALENLVFHLGALPFVYLIAKKLFNEKVSVISSVIYLTNPNILNNSLSGMSEAVFTFFIVTVFYFSLLPDKKFRLFEGFMLGLGFLTRFQGATLVLAYLLFVIFVKKVKRSNIIITGTGFVLVGIFVETLFPQTLANYINIYKYHGQAGLAIGATSDLSISKSVTQVNLEFLFTNLSIFGGKVVKNIFLTIKDLFVFTTPSLVVLYLLSLFSKYADPAKRFKIFLLINISVILLTNLIYIFDFRFVTVLIPIICIFVANYLTKNIVKVSHLVLLLLLLFVIPGYTYSANATNFLKYLKGSYKLDSVHKIVAEVVANESGPGEIVVSDEATFIAWYKDRKTIALPNTFDELIFLDKNLISINKLVLTNHPIGVSQGKFWDDLVESPRDFGEFKFTKEYNRSSDSNYFEVPLKIVIFEKIK